MSTFEKLIIPLIDDCITYKDINTDDFVGVFTEDINMPGLDYVYLVFKYDMGNLRLNIANHGVDCVRQIGNELYHIIKFPKASLDLKRVINGDHNLISNEGISKIYNFWKNIDSDTASYPFGKILASEKYYRVIPEETYTELYTKKTRGLAIPIAASGSFIL